MVEVSFFKKLLCLVWIFMKEKGTISFQNGLLNQCLCFTSWVIFCLLSYGLNAAFLIHEHTQKVSEYRKPSANHMHSELCFVSDFLALDKSLPPFVPHFPPLYALFPTAEPFWIVYLQSTV